METRSIETDVLVLGAGLAGLMAALELNERGLRVVLACKGPLSESNSTYAQGGVAAVLAGTLDHPKHHLQDTLISGAGLSDENVSRTIIEDGNALIEKLSAIGVDFDRKESGELAAAREGGHSHARVLHSKDTTGRAITRALIETLKIKAENNQNLVLLEYAFAGELLTKDGTVYGARLLNFPAKDDSSAAGSEGSSEASSLGAPPTSTNAPITNTPFTNIPITSAPIESGTLQAPLTVVAARTILATGGIGQLFERTTNPLVATGDGIALAYRAGALLRDPEFVQFHPTALCLPGAPAFLISEAVRGEGAILLDGKGERFMPRFHRDAELTTRDIVARAIHSIIVEQELSAVGLDLRPIGSRLSERFPNIVAFCKSHGIDPTVEPVPICPAAHYFMGGIVTDLSGRTTVAGLYAIGECASTGLHGANRLASNSLLEAGVMAVRSAKDISSTIRQLPGNLKIEPKTQKLTVPEDVIMLKSAMYRLAGLVRTGSGLKKLLARLHSFQTQTTPATPAEYEAANMLLLSELIATAALNRTETRGGHYREDYPESRDNFKRHQLVSSKGWSWQDAVSDNGFTPDVRISVGLV